ncbi:MAG: TonB-dependent receptor [Balneolales bacterium]
MKTWIQACITLLLFCILTYVNANAESSNVGMIQGKVIDSETGEPVGWASILIEDLHRSVTAHEDGGFTLRNIPAGEHVVKTSRLGYESTEKTIQVIPGDTTGVILEIKETIFRSSGIEVIGQQFTNGDPTTQTERVVSGRKLRQQLGRTIAETLNDEPGLSQQSMGPAPSRPVLRGLGGERLLILEDGGRTGDLSATSADHALAIEPMTAEQIELIRGPSALMYGSNTIGGVINVVRGQVPVNMPDHVHGSGSFQGESVNRGVSAGATAFGPAGNLAYRLDGSARNAYDITTPSGTLDNSDITTYNGSAGLSYIRSKGMIGASANFLNTGYGIPGGFVGAHPNGVNIEMNRRNFQVKSEYHLNNNWLRRLEVDGSYAYYHHRELEFGGNVGSEFGVLTTNLNAHAHHEGILFSKGMIGLRAENRNYASGGATSTPTTNEQALAGYFYEEAKFDKLNLQAALRYDFRKVAPEEDIISKTIGEIRERSFHNYSASLMATYNLSSAFQMGSILMRTFRAPGVEELFSEGPHLAAYSFEVGNPDLNEERGVGIDLFTRYGGERAQVQLTVFRNQFQDYIYPVNTGEISLSKLLPIYQYVGEDVLMSGAEAGGEIKLLNNLSTSAQISYVRGDIINQGANMPLVTLSDRHEPLSMIPPLTGKIDVEYRNNDLTLGASMRAASSQQRTGEFEQPTDGYGVFDLYAQYMFNSGNMLHTVSLNFDNITNEEYRMHLSRVREIMPEPGRNVKLLYRMYF